MPWRDPTRSGSTPILWGLLAAGLMERVREVLTGRDSSFVNATFIQGPTCVGVFCDHDEPDERAADLLRGAGIETVLLDFHDEAMAIRTWNGRQWQTDDSDPVAMAASRGVIVPGFAPGAPPVQRREACLLEAVDLARVAAVAEAKGTRMHATRRGVVVLGGDGPELADELAVRAYCLSYFPDEARFVCCVLDGSELVGVFDSAGIKPGSQTPTLETIDGEDGLSGICGVLGIPTDFMVTSD